MLITVCGEDTIASRDYIATLKQDCIKKDFEVQNILSKDIAEVYKNDMTARGLFGSKKAYFLDNLNSQISKLKKGPLLEILEKINQDKDTTLINWENGKSSRDLKVKVLGTIKEFKPDLTIFNLLDACFPDNLLQFTNKLKSVAKTQDEGFIYAMLVKHIRTLILAHTNMLPSTVQSWQRGKLSAQAKRWNLEKLVSFYEGLARIDSSLKTSSNVYGFKKSIELLVCYYL